MNFKFVYFWDNEAAMFETKTEGVSSPVWKFIHDFVCFPFGNKKNLQLQLHSDKTERRKTNLFLSLSVQYDSETVIKSLIRRAENPK